MKRRPTSAGLSRTAPTPTRASDCEHVASGRRPRRKPAQSVDFACSRDFRHRDLKSELKSVFSEREPGVAVEGRRNQPGTKALLRRHRDPRSTTFHPRKRDDMTLWL